MSRMALLPTSDLARELEDERKQYRDVRLHKGQEGSDGQGNGGDGGKGVG